MNLSTIEDSALTKYPNNIHETIQYGTAGFRTRANLLNHLVFRMGILAVIRSKAKKAAVGLMITASHNEESDNGVKLVDPAGEMLELSWESIATKFANVPDTQLVQTLRDIIRDEKIDESTPATVIVGRDTRSSSLGLSQAAVQGIEASGGKLLDFGVITTPQLHYLVVCTNTNGAYGEPSVGGYFSKLSRAFAHTRNSKSKDLYTGELFLDAANGVGASAVRGFQAKLHDILTINMFNDGDGELNRNCGADFVKIRQIPPLNNPSEPNLRCASIDGDADRLVYYFLDKEKKFHLLDGDRIATLIASYLQELIKDSGLDVKLGLVQTAYANGASTSYISNSLKIPVACTNTGVKHLHHRAQEFDVGVYFEANGHGTVIFKNEITTQIRNLASDEKAAVKCRAAAAVLSNLIDLINQTVGDALSDMLLVEVILHARGWDIKTWKETYVDFPCRQLKVGIRDRNAIKTTDAERKCTSPPGLQARIDEIVSRYSHGRSFVRPSGTEDVIRVYAECEDADKVEKLAAEVAIAVYELAGGVGTPPVMP